MAETIVYGTSGGLTNGKGTLVCNAQLNYELTGTTDTHYTYTIKVYIHNVRYGYTTTGTLSASWSKDGTEVSADSVSKQSCDLSVGGSKILISTKTWEIERPNSTSAATHTIGFEVSSSGNVVNGTSTGSVQVSIPSKRYCIVAYNANGGSGAPASQNKYYQVTLKLQTGVPTRTNYTFQGWATTAERANAGTVDYAAGANYTTDGTANTTATLYAVWKQNYVKPTISSQTAIRTNSSGTSQTDGTHIKVSFNYTGGNVPGASATLKPYVRIQINGTYVYGSSSAGIQQDAISGSFTPQIFSSYAIGSSHTITINIYDSTTGVSGGNTYTLTVSAATIPIDLLISGSNTYMGIMTAAVSGTILKVPSLNSAGDVTVSGTLYANGNTRVPKITASTSAPSSSDGTNGDVWLVYS